MDPWWRSMYFYTYCLPVETKEAKNIYPVSILRRKRRWKVSNVISFERRDETHQPRHALSLSLIYYPIYTTHSTWYLYIYEFSKKILTIYYISNCAIFFVELFVCIVVWQFVHIVGYLLIFSREKPSGWWRLKMCLWPSWKIPGKTEATQTLSSCLVFRLVLIYLTRVYTLMPKEENISITYDMLSNEREREASNIPVKRA